MFVSTVAGLPVRRVELGLYDPTNGNEGIETLNVVKFGGEYYILEPAYYINDTFKEYSRIIYTSGTVMDNYIYTGLDCDFVHIRNMFVGSHNVNNKTSLDKIVNERLIKALRCVSLEGVGKALPVTKKNDYFLEYAIMNEVLCRDIGSGIIRLLTGFSIVEQLSKKHDIVDLPDLKNLVIKEIERITGNDGASYLEKNAIVVGPTPTTFKCTKFINPYHGSILPLILRSFSPRTDEENEENRKKLITQMYKDLCPLSETLLGSPDGLDLTDYPSKVTISDITRSTSSKK